MIIVFLGGPGSGKSTVGSHLAEDLKWPWISMGEILRESKESWIVEKLKAGQLFDDQMVSGLLFSRLEGVENAIIDGYPRTLKQAEIMVQRGQKIDFLVELSIPIDEVKKRLSLRGREEDTNEVIEDRLAFYENTKMPIQAFLIGCGAKFINIDGVGTQEEVYNRVREALKEYGVE